MWSRLHVRWGNPPHVTSPTWGPPPLCKQALKQPISWRAWVDNAWQRTSGKKKGLRGYKGEKTENGQRVLCASKNKFLQSTKNVECRKKYQLNIKIIWVAIDSFRFQAFFGKISALFNVQAFFAKILALFSAGFDRNLTKYLRNLSENAKYLENLFQKMVPAESENRRIYETSSGPSFRAPE